jgi:hypothetical protein
MKLKSMLIAASIAAMAAPAMANNITTTFGTLTGPYSVGITEFHPQVAPFLDLISFNLTGLSDVTLTLKEIPNVVTPPGGAPIFVWNIQSQSVVSGLYHDGGYVDPNPQAHWVPMVSGSAIGGTQIGWGSHTFSNLMAGNYVFATAGSPDGTRGRCWKS